MFTYPGDDGAEHLMEAYAQANVQTARGITIGSSLKDVEDAYGSDYTRNGNVVSFALPMIRWFRRGSILNCMTIW